MSPGRIHSVPQPTVYVMFTQIRHFSTPRKTAASIASWICSRERKRKALSIQGDLRKRAPHLLGSPTYGPLAEPKYSRNIHEVEQSPPIYSSFDKVVLVPSQVACSSLTVVASHHGRGENGRRSRQIGRLEGSRLVAELLRHAVEHKDNRCLGGSFFQDLSRWIPRLNAKESALVLHALGAMWPLSESVRSLLTRRCVDNILNRWLEVRLGDLARALHATVPVMKFRDFRLLAQTVKSFGHLLELDSVHEMVGLSRGQRRKHLQTLLLLLNVFAYINVPYPSLVAVASTALTHELNINLRSGVESSLVMEGCDLPMKDGGTIFSLPFVSECVASEGGHSDIGGNGKRPVMNNACALEPTEVVRMLESFAALGVRSDPLMYAIEQHVARSVSSSSGILKYRAGGKCVYRPERRNGDESSNIHGSISAAPFRNPASYRYGYSYACTKEAKGLNIRDSYLLRPYAADVSLQSVVGRDTHPTCAFQMSFGAGCTSWWNVNLLTQLMSCFGALGRNSTILVSLWMNAVRHEAHHMALFDLTRTLEVVATLGVHGRPLTKRLFRCLARVIGNLSARVTFSDVLDCASVAARLPDVPQQFWLALQRRLQPLLTAETPAFLPEHRSGTAQLFHSSGSPRCSHAVEKIQSVTAQPSHFPGKKSSFAEVGADDSERLFARGGKMDTATAEMVLQCVAFASPMVSSRILLRALPVLTRVHHVRTSIAHVLRIAVLFRLIHLKSLLASVAYENAISVSDAPSIFRKIVGASEQIWDTLDQVVCLSMKRQGDFSFQLLNDQEGNADRWTPDSPCVRKGTQQPDRWLATTEGPLADLTIRELSLYAIFRPISALSLNQNACQEKGNGGLRHCQSHARLMLTLRQRFSALSICSIEEAVALLHLELLPFCSSFGILAGAVALLDSFADRLWSRQRGACDERRDVPKDSKQNSSRTDCEMQEETNAGCEMPVNSPNSVIFDPNAESSSLSGPENLHNFPSQYSLSFVLEAFSSRIEAAAPNVVLHAARLTLTALRHQRWVQCIADKLRSLEDYSANECSYELHEGVYDRGHLRAQEDTCVDNSVGGSEKHSSTCREFEIIQTTCMICSLVLESVQTRILHYHANGLALLAAEVQRTIVALRKSTHPSMPKEPSRIEHKIGRAELDGWCSNKEHNGNHFSCILKLQKDLNRILEAILTRWRTTPTTVTTAGPASSLNVCIHMFGLSWKCVCSSSGHRCTQEQAQMIFSGASDNRAIYCCSTTSIRRKSVDAYSEVCDPEIQSVWCAAEYEHTNPALDFGFAAQCHLDYTCTNVDLRPKISRKSNACMPRNQQASLGYLCPCRLRRLLKVVMFLKYCGNSQVGDTCMLTRNFNLRICDTCDGVLMNPRNRDVALLWLSRVLAHDRS